MHSPDRDSGQKAVCWKVTLNVDRPASSDSAFILPPGSVQTVEKVVHCPYNLSFIAKVHVVICVRDHHNARAGHTATEGFGPLGTTGLSSPKRAAFPAPSGMRSQLCGQA